MNLRWMSLLIKINYQCSSKVGKEKILPARQKILIILYITWVYNRGHRLLHVSGSFVYMLEELEEFEGYWQMRLVTVHPYGLNKINELKECHQRFGTKF